MQNEFIYSLQIHHEDVDLFGIVYHANYLRYMERARSLWLAQHGIHQQQAWQQGIGFVVCHAELQFRKPARYGDKLEVVSRILKKSHAAVTYEQLIRLAHDATVICIGQIKIACIDNQFRPRPIPKEICCGH